MRATEYLICTLGPQPCALSCFATLPSMWLVSHGSRGPELLVGSVLDSLKCLMQRRGFDLPLGRIFPDEGVFSFKLTWVLTTFPANLSDESINRGLVCAHMHSIARTQKMLTFMS